MKIRNITVLIILLGLASGLVFLFFNYQVNNSHGDSQGKMITIEKGVRAKEVGQMLEEEKLISSAVFFNYYVWKEGISTKIMPGNYYLSENMTIPEIAILLMQSEVAQKKVTFPEGWTLNQMAERLSENELSGEDFLDLAKQPEMFYEEYSFIDRSAKNLEGYLFPDTYFFSVEAQAEDIIKKMLDNFNDRVGEYFIEIENQGKNLEEILTMASIIEKEVSDESDQKTVSGIFWNRISIGQALQSCATVAYVLGENKKQFTYEETRVDSPYNTYMNPGLPPGPINNPGLSSLKAAIYPENTNYNYFLNDPETGNTVFSRTLEEHNLNKYKYGL